MKTIACASVLFLGALLGCQTKDTGQPPKTTGGGPTPSVVAAPPGSDYAKDIESLCESVSRSGADPDDPGAKALTIANWLAANLKTPESRQFLVKIQPLVGNDKAEALETEAHRVGLSGCALAAEWRVPTP